MIYLDCHATTPCDHRVVEAMLPWLTQSFGNPHSDSHPMGREAAEAIEQSLDAMSRRLGVARDALLVTSGATESNNLALRGVMGHPRCRRPKLVTCTTEHPAVLDVVDDLQGQPLQGRDGSGRRIEVVRVGVHPNGHPAAGQIDLDQLAEAVDENTMLVSVMWANNETGVVQPIQEVAELVHRAGALLHCDATQAIGRLPVDVRAADVDLLSGSAHKFYGPKGVGFLVAGNGNRRVRLRPQIVGGGQQRGLRSGTMNPAGVVAMAKAMELACDEMSTTAERLWGLRQQLWADLCEGIGDLRLNGPAWPEAMPTPDAVSQLHRLPGNLNFQLPDFEGESWMAAASEVAFSSGSACSSTDATPSHVLLAMGLTESQARRSVRFGLGRMLTADELRRATEWLLAAADRVRSVNRGLVKGGRP